MPGEDWALLNPAEVKPEITLNEDGSAQITNGKITAKVTRVGKIKTIYKGTHA